MNSSQNNENYTSLESLYTDYFSNIKYPVTKSELLEQLRYSDAPYLLFEQISNLPVNVYNDFKELLSAIATQQSFDDSDDFYDYDFSYFESNEDTE